MYYKSLIDLSMIMVAYLLLFLAYPAYVFRPLTKQRNAAERFLIHIIIGNVYVIILVFLLAYLGIFNRFTLGISLLISGIGIRYYLDKVTFIEMINQFYSVVHHLFTGEYGFKLFLQNLLLKFIRLLKRLWQTLFKGNIFEHSVFVGLLAYNIYYYSYNSLKFVSYGAPDEEVHLYWIQSLISGDLFPSGVYPHGFHNIISAISVLFGINANSVIAIFGVVVAMLAITMLFIGLKKVLVFKPLAIIGIFTYSVFDMYNIEAISRFQYAIPQEYGIIVLIPMIIFLFNYLKDHKKLDLVMFGLSFSLSISFHFYVTIIALVICLAIGLAFIHRIFKEKLFLKIIICGILSTALGLLPLAAGVMMGHPLEQSMQWATSVIAGDIYEETDTEEEIEEATLIESINKSMKKHVFNQLVIFYTFIGILILVILFNVVARMINRNHEVALYQIAFVLIFAGFIFLMLCRPLGLPTIMETKRVAIFFAYLSGFIIVVPFDLIYRILKRYNFDYMIAVLLLAMTPTLVLGLTDYDLLKDRPLFYYFQTKGAMLMNHHIMEEYSDWEWTVISPVNDLSAIMNNGYHYEIADFILDQENWQSDVEITIPTKYVFVYIEKQPIQYYGFRFEENDPAITHRPNVTYVDAKTNIEESLSEDSLYIDNRHVVMSKAYYWAKQYQQYFPDEMIVYYEDDELMVYRITQNEYALNNFAINYGFNDVSEKEGQ